jgi:rhodanese-related sulfurtransferase
MSSDDAAREAVQWGYRNVRWYREGLSGWRGTDRATAVADADWIDQMITDGAVVLDTRSPADYAAGHLPGARNIPVENLIANPEAALPDLPFGKTTSLILLATGAPQASHYQATEALRNAAYTRISLSSNGAE